MATHRATSLPLYIPHNKTTIVILWPACFMYNWCAAKMLTLYSD